MSTASYANGVTDQPLIDGTIGRQSDAARMSHAAREALVAGA